MIQARAYLYRHLQEFFEREIFQQYRWHEVRHFAAENAPIPPGRSRHPLGRYREQVRVAFGPDWRFQLEILSPEEAPPLGSVRLITKNYPDIEGPIERETWKRIGAFIRTHSEKAFEDV